MLDEGDQILVKLKINLFGELAVKVRENTFHQFLLYQLELTYLRLSAILLRFTLFSWL